MTKENITKLSYSAMFMAIAILLPFMTGQIKQFGVMLLPMHLPILMCAFLCGPSWGFAVGVITPILRSAICGMPVMFPSAVCMSVELGVYAVVCGIMHKLLPKKYWANVISLITAIVVGRIVWGVLMYTMTVKSGGFFPFMAEKLSETALGTAILIIFVPIFITIINKKQKEVSNEQV